MKKKKMLAVLLSMTLVFSFAACGKSDSSSGDGGNSSGNTGGSSTGKQDVTLRIWGAEEDQAMLSGMIDTFKAKYADQANFTIELGVESESTAKDTVLADVEAAADVYAFASDQLFVLLNGGALQCIDDMDGALQSYAGKSVADVKSANGEGSVEAASVDGKMYAFPMSADNGYFLYYDSNTLSADDVKSWDALLAAAGNAGKKVGMVYASGWWNASFFYGAGFTTGLNSDGTTSIDWNGTSSDGYTGVSVVKAMTDIAASGAFLAIADGDVANQIASGALCAVVDGTWDAAACQSAWGDGYAATKLPTFTLDGKQVQQGSVAGYKMVAVNAYSKNVGWATLLADWITNEENQAIRFATREIGPSNTAVAASSAVKENIAIAALAEQSAYGVVQNVGGKFWDPTATFGTKIAQGEINRDNDAEIQAALDEMVTGVTAPVE